ncbi:hypothetical protein [Methylogaea oryzae]|uniref:hypothetical protein n=1 Tax=Methylogaea oryzae TaxID=1295382 RepID=UPI0006D1475F|nr:hypothetical protein [Methylogaea oryzae]
MQGWEPGPTFKERFRTKARAVRDYDGITHLEFDGLSTVAVSYGKKAAESYTYGKHSSLQTAIYDKSKEVLASDKKDFFDKEWEAYSLGRYDKDKPVWRIEYRFHHSVIAQFAESAGQDLKKFTDLLPHLGDLWRYALLRNRLDETPNGTYIDPLWQYLYDRMNVSFGPSARRLTRQYKKDSVAPAAKNYGQIIGNIVSVCARRGYNTRQVMLQLKRLDFYDDLVKLYRDNGKGGEPALRETVEKALCLRRLIGKAAA